MAPDWMASRLRDVRYELALDQEEEEQQKSIRRLKTMENTLDGFKIAEVDLELRGPGDFFGRRQSGLPELQIANLVTDTELLATARSDAFDLVAADPHLRSTDHQQLQTFLKLHMREALELLQVG
jgi:ATP-dependent DNA helicase RecG